MTNIFIRITDIINANINDMLDKVEDPEQMIRQIIREMEENIHQARERVLDALTHEKELAKELAAKREKAEAWRKKAELAIRAGDDDLARKALSCKKEYEGMSAELESAYDVAKTTTGDLKTQLWALESKLETAKRKRSSLAARQRAAEARQYLNRSNRCYEKGLRSEEKFSRMEDRVRAIESRTEAIVELDNPHSELEKEFESMERETDVDLELETMKKELGKS